MTHHHQYNHESDHDRLVRIETALHHLTEHLAVHTEELRQHIRDETLDFTDLRQKLVIHLNESENMQATLNQVVTDVSLLKSERMRFVGWIAGAVFVVIIVWTIFSEFIAHYPKKP